MLNRESLLPWLMPFGCALVFVGYLNVWLPNEAASLSLMGLELAEWIKFMPQVRFGQLDINRNWLYLPPVTLSIALSLYVASWPARAGFDWQAWGARVLAFAFSWLALPPPEMILNEPSAEWRLRIMLVAVAGLIALVTGLIRLPGGVIMAGIVVCALVGAVVPTRLFFLVRPSVIHWLQRPVGIGPGVWLNLFGHLLILLAARFGLPIISGTAPAARKQ